MKSAGETLTFLYLLNIISEKEADALQSKWEGQEVPSNWHAFMQKLSDDLGRTVFRKMI